MNTIGDHQLKLQDIIFTCGTRRCDKRRHRCIVIGFPGNQLTPGKYLTRTEGWKNEWSADRDYDFLTEIPFRVIAGP